MAGIADLQRNFYITALGLTAQQGAAMSLADLQFSYYSNPPAGGGGVQPGDLASVAFSGLASDLTGTLSVEQAAPGTVIAVKATGTTFPANPTTRTDVEFDYIGSDGTHPPVNARANDLWDHS